MSWPQIESRGINSAWLSVGEKNIKMKALLPSKEKLKNNMPPLNLYHLKVPCQKQKCIE